LSDNVGLTLSGGASFTVTGLVGNMAAGSLTGSLTVTTGDAGDNGIAIVTGSASTSITDGFASDTVSVNAAALADNAVLTLSGGASFTVTGLRGDLDAAAAGGALTVTTASVASGLSITTSGPVSSNIDASALTAGQTLTLGGSGGNGNYVTLNGGNLDATGSTRNLIVSGGTGANIIQAGNAYFNLIMGGGGADVLAGGTGGDTFVFGAADGLNTAASIDGGAGSDAIQLNAAAVLTDASFAQATSIEMLTLSGSSTVTLGANAANAGITTVLIAGGSASTTINDSNGVALSVDAFLQENTTLTLSGSTAQSVRQIFGDIDASGLTGTLSVTTRDAIDDGIAIVTGSASTSISDSFASDVVSVNAAALADHVGLTLAGGASFTVTGLRGNLDAAAVGGALTVTTASVASGLSIATGSGSTTVDASALVAGESVTLTGSHAATVTLAAGNLSAGLYTGDLIVTGGSGANSIVVGHGSQNTIKGGDGADVITGGQGNDRIVFDFASESTWTAPDTIVSFAGGTGSDRDLIDFTNIAGIASSGGVPYFRGDVSGQSLAPHTLGYFESGGDTWIVVNTEDQEMSFAQIASGEADMAIILVGTSLGLVSSNFSHA
jgi:hypothetical protein